MSKCGRTHLLDAMTAGETTPALELDLRTHAAGCARCHHELSWLDSEQRLFRARAGRDEVASLWQGVEQRTPKLRTHGINRMLIGLASALLVVLGVGRLTVKTAVGSSVSVTADDDDSLQSFEAMSFVSSEDVQADKACSTLTPGLGFYCGSVEASVFASR